MTPGNKIRREILIDALNAEELLRWGELTDENIDEAYEAVNEEDDVYDGVCLQDCESGFRESGQVTDIPCEWDRHYESESRARQLSDGSWIGWTYWHGGGKYGEPEAIDWISDAYELEVESVEKMTVHYTYKKRETL